MLTHKTSPLRLLSEAARRLGDVHVHGLDIPLSVDGRVDKARLDRSVEAAVTAIFALRRFTLIVVSGAAPAGTIEHLLLPLLANRGVAGPGIDFGICVPAGVRNDGTLRFGSSDVATERLVGCLLSGDEVQAAFITIEAAETVCYVDRMMAADGDVFDRELRRLTGSLGLAHEHVADIFAYSGALQPRPRLPSSTHIEDLGRVA